MDRKSVLIIKHGFSQRCDRKISPLINYSDVFRCTSLLEGFSDRHVVWVTARAGLDLLMGNHLINELILADGPEELPEKIRQGRYQTIINLEKQKDWCEFTAKAQADVRYGFKDWTGSGLECYYAESAKMLSKVADDDYRPYQDRLYRIAGSEWTGQRYVLGYRPRVVPIYDIGLNNQVETQWPSREWRQGRWRKLYNLLSERYAVSWQPSSNNIRRYTDWLASCRLIVTCDSLGLHLGLGLNRKIVALFGPTAPENVYLYGNGIKLASLCDRQCMPCNQGRCHCETHCMEYIPVDMVVEAVEMMLGTEGGLGYRSIEQTRIAEPLEEARV